MSKKKKKQENLEPVYRKKLIKRRKPNRSIWGDIFLYLFLLFVAFVMAFPLIYAVSSALKPLDELYKFPPKILAQNPTLDNFSDLFVTMGKSWVTFSRYLFNTVFITAVGTFGHLIIASMGAFVLAKFDFPCNQSFF
ncbi:MAG: carbohydrate ABC transporter permease, partial [Lachnospiraceae bacterium]|nr:carbohydrate ABC transporter permease [Lachnospiraceae bacterium]